MSRPIQARTAASTQSETTAAIDEVLSELTQGDVDFNLAIVFFSLDHRDKAENISARLQQELNAQVIGCSGEAVVSDATEYEHDSILSVLALSLPDTEMIPIHLELQHTPDGPLLAGWPDSFSTEWPPEDFLLLLGEPFSFPTEALLERMNENNPGIAIIGGMASGGQTTEENVLLLNDAVHRGGAVAIRLSGNISLTPVVSQGCRPVGKTYVITKAERNVVYELGGRAAVLQLKELFDELTPEEQQLVQGGLLLGRVMSEYQDEFRTGDFLVRNVMGLDQEHGAIVVGDYMRTGQTVQFHVRDESTAHEELEQLLAAAVNEANSPAAALLFTCNGRGTRMFSEANHDARAIQKHFPQLPVAGFFAQGEIGPVGKTNHVHGFTASIALLSSKVTE